MEECQTLFSKAFGEVTVLEHLQIGIWAGPQLVINSATRYIILHISGEVMAGDTTNNKDAVVWINVRHLLTQLDAYNVAFGEAKPATQS